MSDEHATGAFRKIINPGGHTCFGCSGENASGLGMEFHTDGSVVVSRLAVPPHLCGWNDMAHGGVISTIMDEIMSWAAMRLLGRFILTRSITVEFIRPVMVGREVRAEGRVRERVSEREAVMEGLLYDCEGTLCARATGRFALFKKEDLARKGLFDAAMLEGFESVFTS
ncbi:MAG: PaaI family thioesterase [Spirochaetes bacterium]|nr:PaaI family thioesterase [Spirochaetota bacterium]